MAITLLRRACVGSQIYCYAAVPAPRRSRRCFEASATRDPTTRLPSSAPGGHCTPSPARGGGAPGGGASDMKPHPQGGDPLMLVGFGGVVVPPGGARRKRSFDQVD